MAWKPTVALSISSILAVSAFMGISAFRREREQRATELAALRQEVSALSGQLRQTSFAAESNGLAIRSLENAATAAPSTTPAPSGPSSGSGAESAGASRRSAQQTEQEMREEIQARFDSDARDGRWAKRETIDKLTAVLPEGVTLGSVECRTSMCRVESTAPDVPHLNGFIKQAFTGQEKPIPGDVMNVRLSSPAERPVVVVSYVSRGGPLPALP